MKNANGNNTGLLPFERRVKSPEELLEEEIRERFVAIRARAGVVPTQARKAWHRIANERGCPARMPARLAKTIKRARLSREDARDALVKPLEAYIDRLWGTAA